MRSTSTGTSSHFAYGRLGPRTGVPLIMATRFRGTTDHWDPALLDLLSSEREVIVFDKRCSAVAKGVAQPTSATQSIPEFDRPLGTSPDRSLPAIHPIERVGVPVPNRLIGGGAAAPIDVG